MMDKVTFREDINGLRALAVISVFIFHFSHGKLPGGFVGVDVFFVISGFLMTSIIFRGLENDNFSIWKFWLDRVRRIVPALLAVTFLLLIIGITFINLSTFKLIGNHSKYSLLFISNYKYMYESGYFDLDSYQKFLLHTWSLAVEFQFYIFYPIILIVLNRFLSISKIKKIYFVLALASFIYCIFISFKNSTHAYFMIDSRIWEFMLGGLAFIYPLKISDKHRFKIEFIGLVLIVLSFIIISDKMI